MEEAFLIKNTVSMEGTSLGGDGNLVVTQAKLFGITLEIGALSNLGIVLSALSFIAGHDCTMSCITAVGRHSFVETLCGIL